MITAEYIDHMGSDLRVVNAARVSFNKESDWVQRPYAEDGLNLLSEELPAQYDPYEDWPLAFDDQQRELSDFMLSERDTKLIRYLARHDHWTPFAHCMITLRETVPIFVARQRFKHMVGFTYNEVSRRYIDDAPEIYWPKVWRKRAPNKKQGSSDEEISTPISVKMIYEDTITESLEAYYGLLDRGVCPEQARMVLPQSMLTSYYVTGSLAAFARAYKQRVEPHAQEEIQGLASLWDAIINPLFPVSWEALTCTS